MRTEQQLLEEINRDLPPGVDWKAGAERYVRDLVARGGAPFRRWHLTKPFLAEPLAGEPLHGDASRPAVDPDVTYHELFGFLNVVRAASPPPGARVLDVGCGPGWTSHYLGKMGYTVLGFDISEEMLELARERVDAEPFPPDPGARLDVRFVRHDIEALPLGETAGEPYDLALVDSVLHHFLDPVAALRHLGKSLRPGAQLAIIEALLPEGAPVDPTNRAIMERYHTIERPYTASQMADILRLAGFPHHVFLYGIERPLRRSRRAARPRPRPCHPRRPRGGRPRAVGGAPLLRFPRRGARRPGAVPLVAPVERPRPRRERRGPDLLEHGRRPRPAEARRPRERRRRARDGAAPHRGRARGPLPAGTAPGGLPARVPLRLLVLPEAPGPERGRPRPRVPAEGRARPGLGGEGAQQLEGAGVAQVQEGQVDGRRFPVREAQAPGERQGERLGSPGGGGRADDPAVGELQQRCPAGRRRGR